MAKSKQPSGADPRQRKVDALVESTRQLEAVVNPVGTPLPPGETHSPSAADPHAGLLAPPAATPTDPLVTGLPTVAGGPSASLPQGVGEVVTPPVLPPRMRWALVRGRVDSEAAPGGARHVASGTLERDGVALGVLSIKLPASTTVGEAMELLQELSLRIGTR